MRADMTHGTKRLSECEKGYRRWIAPRKTIKPTKDQLCALKGAWHCLCSGGLCENSLDQMKELESLGLIELTPPPDEWPEAEYGYLMTDRGEKLIEQKLKPSNL